MLKSIAFYACTIGLFVGGVLLILHLGAGLPPGRAEPVTRSDPTAAGTHRPAPAGPAGGAYRVFLDHLRHPLPLLLLQLIVIVGAARLVGALFRKIGQPSVIGEMVAGLLAYVSENLATWAATLLLWGTEAWTWLQTAIPLLIAQASTMASQLVGYLADRLPEWIDRLLQWGTAWSMTSVWSVWPWRLARNAPP